MAVQSLTATAGAAAEKGRGEWGHGERFSMRRKPQL